MDLDAEYSEYKAYIEEFAKTIDPNDQLPLRVSGYCLRDFEIHGEILDWLMSYLGWVKRQKPNSSRSSPAILPIHDI